MLQCKTKPSDLRNHPRIGFTDLLKEQSNSILHKLSADIILICRYNPAHKVLQRRQRPRVIAVPWCTFNDTGLDGRTQSNGERLFRSSTSEALNRLRKTSLIMVHHLAGHSDTLQTRSGAHGYSNSSFHHTGQYPTYLPPLAWQVGVGQSHRYNYGIYFRKRSLMSFVTGFRHSIPLTLFKTFLATARPARAVWVVGRQGDKVVECRFSKPIVYKSKNNGSLCRMRRRTSSFQVTSFLRTRTSGSLYPEVQSRSSFHCLPRACHRFLSKRYREFH